MFCDDFCINSKGFVVGENYRECVTCHQLFYYAGVVRKNRCQACRAKARLTEPYNKRVWFVARARARDLGLDFTIDPEDVVMPPVCPILGIKLEVNRQTGGLANSPSLDRKDNSKGYIKGNVWVISNLANQMKSSSNIEQLQLFADWINKEYPR